MIIQRVFIRLMAIAPLIVNKKKQSINILEKSFIKWQK